MTTGYPIASHNVAPEGLAVPQTEPQSSASVRYVTSGDRPELSTAGGSNRAVLPFRVPTPLPGGAPLLILDRPAQAPYGPASCAWPRRGLPAGAYLEAGRYWYACNCECGCLRAMPRDRYRRCRDCGAGDHRAPIRLPVPTALRGMLAFGDFVGAPANHSPAAQLHARLDTHLASIRAASEQRREGAPTDDPRNPVDSTHRPGLRRMAG